MAADLKEQVHVAATSGIDTYAGKDSSSGPATSHGTPEVVPNSSVNREDSTQTQSLRTKMRYLFTKEFAVVVVLGQALAIANTGASTLTTLLANEKFSIPAFQSFFNYVLLTFIYTGYTLYKYGFKKWALMVRKNGWRYFILAFCDCEGNYFTVLAYRYTTILSAQLINFWAIAVVVALSFTFLRVRYHWAQILGIFVCIGGMGMLMGSDYMSGVNTWKVSRGDQLKGDLFALAGATFYGLSNLAEEYFVSKAPLYEVVGQLGFWGMFISGVQTAIFDRHGFHTALWNSKVGGYLTGFTLILTCFYTAAPIMYRLSSAAFFNISLLTMNFWGVVIGIQLFHYHIATLYPVAFVLIMLGHFIYYFGKGVLGEAKKSWLGENQEGGVSGWGTARAKILADDGTVGNGESRNSTVAEHTGPAVV